MDRMDYGAHWGGGKRWESVLLLYSWWRKHGPNVFLFVPYSVTLTSGCPVLYQKLFFFFFNIDISDWRIFVDVIYWFAEFFFR